MDPDIIQGILNSMNEANAAIPTDGEFAQDVVAVLQFMLAEEGISVQLVDGQYVLPSVQEQQE